MVAATMVRNPIDIWFDFIDPASVLLLLDIHAGGDEGPEWVRESEFRWRPCELRPPPTPLIGIDHADIAPAWAAARPTAAAAGLDLAPPKLVPWSRKAHELVEHATGHAAETGSLIRVAIARAYALEAKDIGRVDVLVDIAIRHGLDRTETKAVLDVDRYDAQVAASTREAARVGITATPTIICGERRVQGFHNCTVLGTLLGI